LGFKLKEYLSGVGGDTTIQQGTRLELLTALRETLMASREASVLF
jgi:hypothetical protein